MAIVFENPPAKSLQVLEEGLAGLKMAVHPSIHEVLNKLNKFAGDAIEHLKMAHRVYALRLDRLAQGGPLEEAELLSWRYIVNPAIDSIISADVRIGPGETHIFSEFGLNRIAGKTVLQLAELVKDKKLVNKILHARLLRVFGLRFAALWLHQPGAKDFKDDIFIPLADASSSLIAGRQYSGDELATALHKKAAEQIKLVSNTSS